VTYHCWFNHQPTTTIVLVSLTIHGLKRQWYVTAGFWLCAGCYRDIHCRFLRTPNFFWIFQVKNQ
jgi:hypothetical protein